jgi:hypothetical protein
MQKNYVWKYIYFSRSTVRENEKVYAENSFYTPGWEQKLQIDYL